MATRSQCQPWRSEYMTAPPSACNQLAGNAWGHTCSGTGHEPVLSCYPWSASAPAIDERLFWSPAIACPQGWILSTMRTTPDSPRATDGDAEWISGETAITCCPSGFGGWDASGRCRWEGSTTYSNTPCMSGNSAVKTATLSTQSTTSRPTLFASKLRLRYQQSDLTQPPQGTPNGPNDTNENGGLSIGAKAAIGAVVPIVIITLVIGLLVFRQRRNRRQSSERPEVKTSTNTMLPSKAELDANTSEQPQYNNEQHLPGVPPQSPARGNVSELDGRS
jgi:hypothetical protein